MFHHDPAVSCPHSLLALQIHAAINVIIRNYYLYIVIFLGKGYFDDWQCQCQYQCMLGTDQCIGETLEMYGNNCKGIKWRTIAG